MLGVVDVNIFLKKPGQTLECLTFEQKTVCTIIWNRGSTSDRKNHDLDMLFLAEHSRLLASKVHSNYVMHAIVVERKK